MLLLLLLNSSSGLIEHLSLVPHALISEPVIDLADCQTALLCNLGFFFIGRIGVMQVVEEPVVEDICCLFAQVAFLLFALGISSLQSTDCIAVFAFQLGHHFLWTR